MRTFDRRRRHLCPGTSLTAVEMDLLHAIEELTLLAGGVSPSRQELAAELDVSPSRISDLISRLVERGHLRRLPGRARALYVTTRLPMPPEPLIVGLFEDPARAALVHAA